MTDSALPLLSVDNVNAVRVRNPQDVRRAAEALHRISFEGVQMRVATAHDIADKRTPVDSDGNILARDVFGWENGEKSWWKNPGIALVSPITTACRFESEPFWVSALGFRTRAPNPYLDAIDMTNFEQRSLTRTAIVVPVHLPFGKIGAVSFHPIDRDITDIAGQYEAYADSLGLLARTFISSYVQATGGIQRLPPGSRLSKREVECLRWVAIGKTDDEIGMIMGRSRATIRFHMHNASAKLDAVNRSQTVFKATQLGYISLEN